MHFHCGKEIETLNFITARRYMDTAKCNALKHELGAQPEPQLLAIDRFFDGNVDLGSIGCNLAEHPGMDAFREVLAGLMSRADVNAVYAQISELDPGEESWPFTDTVLVVASIPRDELARILAPLMPDEVVGSSDAWFLSKSLSDAERASTLVAWWD